MTTRRRFLTLSGAALAMPAVMRSAFADAAWPTAKPIRMICPFGAGSTVDVLARLVTDPLAQAIGQSVVVENRGGAGGMIGSAVVARAEPDGYAARQRRRAYRGAGRASQCQLRPGRDFAGIAMIGVVPNVIVVAPSRHQDGQGPGRARQGRADHLRPPASAARRTGPPNASVSAPVSRERTFRSAAGRRR